MFETRSYQHEARVYYGSTNNCRKFLFAKYWEYWILILLRIFKKVIKTGKPKLKEERGTQRNGRDEKPDFNYSSSKTTRFLN